VTPHDALLREALFASDLQNSPRPDGTQVRAAISRTLHDLGVRGCVERVAQEFGDHPELAVSRMRWATALVGGFAALLPSELALA